MNCKVCGRVFTQVRGNQIYCSKECRREAKREKDRRYIRGFKAPSDLTPPCGELSCFECPHTDCII